MQKVSKNTLIPSWLWAIVTFGLLVFLVSCNGTSSDINTGIPSPGLNQTEEPLRIRGVQEIDLSNFAKIPLEAQQLQISSLNHPSQGRESLVQPGVEGFWHVKVPKEETRPWIMVDLGEERPLALLRVLPRAGQAQQMWRGSTTDLQASHNEQNWATIATLSIIPWPPTEDWINFPLLSSQAYRYYRLSIWDTDFYSMARLELYQLAGYGPPLP